MGKSLHTAEMVAYSCAVHRIHQMLFGVYNYSQQAFLAIYILCKSDEVGLNILHFRTSFLKKLSVAAESKATIVYHLFY